MRKKNVAEEEEEKAINWSQSDHGEKKEKEEDLTSPRGSSHDIIPLYDILTFSVHQRDELFIISRGGKQRGGERGGLEPMKRTHEDGRVLLSFPPEKLLMHASLSPFILTKRTLGGEGGGGGGIS